MKVGTPSSMARDITDWSMRAMCSAPDLTCSCSNDWIGGAATSRSLTPGFLYSNCSYVCSLFRPEIMRDLELPRFGLQVISYEGGAVFTQDGDYLANIAIITRTAGNSRVSRRAMPKRMIDMRAM